MENSALTALIKAIFGWKAVVDIVLIAAGLFFLYHTLLRLGTWRILAGIMLAASLFLIANFLDLKGLEWIFSLLQLFGRNFISEFPDCYSSSRFSSR